MIGLILASHASAVAGVGAVDTPRDGFDIMIPGAVRDAVDERFPGFAVWEIRTTPSGRGTRYEITVFDPRSTAVRSRGIGDSTRHGRATYELVVSGTGTVVSEDRHPIPEDRVPAAAVSTFRDWRRELPHGMTVVWGAFQGPGEERRYVANVVVNAVESHVLILKHDGTIEHRSRIEATND